MSDDVLLIHALVDRLNGDFSGRLVRRAQRTGSWGFAGDEPVWLVTDGGFSVPARLLEGMQLGCDPVGGDLWPWRPGEIVPTIRDDGLLEFEGVRFIIDRRCE